MRGAPARRDAECPPTLTLPFSSRAERSGGSGFTAGFILGGLVCGAAAFVFAPQISAALLDDESKLKLPRVLDDGDGERSPELTKAQLADRIAQLNSAIDDVSAQLRAQDEFEAVDEALA